MERTLKIDGNNALWDIPSFEMAVNDTLKIAIESKEMRVGLFRLTIDGLGEYSLKNPIEIPMAKFKNTTIYFKLSFCDLDETKVIKSDYVVEPLKINTDGDLTTVKAVLQAITSEVDKLSTEVENLSQRLKEYENGGIVIETI